MRPTPPQFLTLSHKPHHTAPHTNPTTQITLARLAPRLLLSGGHQRRYSSFIQPAAASILYLSTSSLHLPHHHHKHHPAYLQPSPSFHPTRLSGSSSVLRPSVGVNRQTRLFASNPSLPTPSTMPFTSALVQSIQKANNGDFADMRENFEENEIKLQALNPLMRSLRNQLSYALHELHDGAVEVSGPLLEDVFVKVRKKTGRALGRKEGNKTV